MEQSEEKSWVIRRYSERTGYRKGHGLSDSKPKEKIYGNRTGRNKGHNQSHKE